MKALIAAACICVIGFTAYYAASEYSSYRRGAAIAFHMKCEDAIEAAKDAAALPNYQRREIQRTLEECMARARGR